jgi:transposase-like protein
MDAVTDRADADVEPAGGGGGVAVVVEKGRERVDHRLWPSPGAGQGTEDGADQVGDGRLVAQQDRGLCVEELLTERGIEVDHVTVFRWVQRFTPLLAEAARFARHAPGDRWYVDETYVKVNGVWRYVYRAVDQYGQVIDVLVSTRRDAAAARRFFRRAIAALKVRPSEVVTDASPVYPAVLDELIPSASHQIEQYANNPIGADHSQLKQRLRPMRGLRTDRTAQVIIAGS